jgi:hypothetical protein
MRRIIRFIVGKVRYLRWQDMINHGRPKYERESSLSFTPKTRPRQ